MSRRTTLALLALAVVAPFFMQACREGDTGMFDGSFESGFPSTGAAFGGWQPTGGSEPPTGAEPAADTNEHTAGNQSLRVGANGATAGRAGRAIKQVFFCGEDAGFCTIYFDSKFVVQDGERVKIEFASDLGGATAAYIPDATNGFKSFVLSVQGCDRVTLTLEIEETLGQQATAGAQSTLWLDNVKSTCEFQDLTNHGGAQGVLKSADGTPLNQD